MAKVTKKRGPGRPQSYPLTPAQEKSIRSRIAKGETSKMIEEALGVHAFAILRVRRALRKEATSAE